MSQALDTFRSKNIQSAGFQVALVLPRGPTEAVIIGLALPANFPGGKSLVLGAS